MILTREVTFEIGDFVTFNNKIGNDKGVVTGYTIRKTSIMYYVVWSNKKEEVHYDFELVKN